MIKSGPEYLLRGTTLVIKNGAEYLTRRTAWVIISLMKFLLHSLVSRSFFIRLRYTFLLLFFILTCLIMSASKILVIFMFCNLSDSFDYLSFSIFHYKNGTFFFSPFVVFLLFSILSMILSILRRIPPICLFL